MARRGGKLGNAVLDLDIDDSKYTSGLDRTKKRTQGWMSTLGRDVKRGIGMGIGITAATGVASVVSSAISGVQQVVAGSIAAAMEWESAFAGVRKTVDASESEFADLEQGLRNMSMEIPIAATELAGLAEAAGALGIAKRDIQEFTRITALIGTTTDVSSDQAATSLGQLSNVLDLTSDDYERFGSTLVDLGNKGASTESQILEIASRAGAGSKLLGMATDETLAWASAVANLGIEVEAGGSSLQTFFLRTSKAVSEGGDKLETYGRIAGMTAAEFKRAFEQDATAALQTFLERLGRLSQGDQLKALADLDFNDVRITRTLLGLAGNAENLGNSLSVANEAWEENNALAQEAAKRFDTTESKMQILNNRVNDLAITFGEEMLPGLTELATWGVEQLEQFTEEVVTFVDSVADSARWLDIYFGDMGKAVEDRAGEIGEDVGEMKDRVLYAMNELNLGVEQAIAWAERDLNHLPQVITTVTGNVADNLANVPPTLRGAMEEGVAAAEGALAAGDLSGEADALFSEVDQEAIEAREAAVDAMRTMLDRISALFASDTTLRDEFQALLDRMDDPYTEAERKADIFSQNTIAVIRGALQSGDPLIVADTLTLVNNMLSQFDLMEPGALERGDAVPPALRAGMEQQVAGLLTFIENEITGEALTNLTLEEAKQLGLDGIWLYAQGIKSQKEEAARQAAIVASRALNVMDSVDWYGGGAGAGVAWANGLRSSSDWARLMAWEVAASADAALHGRSPPVEGPLSTIDDGGYNVGLAWAMGLGSADKAVQHVADTLAGTAYAGLTAVRPIGMPTLPGAGLLGRPDGSSAVLGTGGSVVNHVEYHLHYGGTERVFESRTAFLDDLEGLARFNDGGVH